MKTQIFSLRFFAPSAPLRHLLLLCLFVSSVSCLPATAGTVTGTVRNGTTGAVVPNQEVILIQLQGGMQSAGTWKTDASGRFSIDFPALGQQPMLIRVQYKGVNYHASVPPGTSNADVKVFEATKKPDGLSIESRLVALQPNGGILQLTEEFGVHNHTNPRVSIFDEQGNFDFAVPEGGELHQVSAAGPSGMPIVVGTIEKGNGKYAIAYAFRPGETSVRVSYKIPYSTNQAQVKLLSPYSAKSVMVISPPAVQVQGDGFSARGQEQGWSVFSHDAVAANATLALNVSGTGPAPSETDAGGGGDSPAMAGNVSVVPPRIDNLKWILIVGLVMFMSLGGFFLWKRPVPQTQPAGAVDVPAPAPVTTVKVTRPGASNAGSIDNVIAAARQEAARRLDEVKEMLVRIELRKQAGAISDADYAAERARAEAMLRELLK